MIWLRKKLLPLALNNGFSLTDIVMLLLIQAQFWRPISANWAVPHSPYIQIIRYFHLFAIFIQNWNFC
jgi:hypothetical protein